MNYIVTGFPHCGTSILKCLIADEFGLPAHEGERSAPIDGTVTKWWFAPDIDFTLEDTHYFFILRDPRYVFTSLKKRFGMSPVQVHKHTLRDYISCLSLAQRLQEQPNVSFYKYEKLHKVFASTKRKKHTLEFSARSKHTARRERQINEPLRNFNESMQLDHNGENALEMEHALTLYMHAYPKADKLLEMRR